MMLKCLCIEGAVVPADNVVRIRVHPSVTIIAEGASEERGINWRVFILVLVKGC